VVGNSVGHSRCAASKSVPGIEFILSKKLKTPPTDIREKSYCISCTQDVECNRGRVDSDVLGAGVDSRVEQGEEGVFYELSCADAEGHSVLGGYPEFEMVEQVDVLQKARFLW
jgi:hypothetical protein